MKATRDPGRAGQWFVLLAGTVAVAALLTIVVIGALNPRNPSTGAGASPTPGTGSLLPTPSASPSPPPTDPIAAKATSIVDSSTRSHPPAAAAYLTTTYKAYAASLPDTAGIEGSPSPSDVVILVEIEGYFPASHSCGFIMGACYDTGILVAFDQTLDKTLEVTYGDDPWSRDRPSPGPSVSERFALLRRFGTPVTLQLPN